MFCFRTVWVTRIPHQPIAFEVYPPSETTSSIAKQTFLITNDPSALLTLGTEKQAVVVDAMALVSLALSFQRIERVEQLFGEHETGAEALWQVWQKVDARLVAFPLWALETLELLFRDLDELALAKLIGRFAERVRLSWSGCGAWRETFPAEHMRSEKRQLPTHEDCTPLDEQRLASHLLPGGTFSRMMPGYESREGQVTMVRAVVNAFNESHHLLVEAGTGVGKSLAYLIPVAAWARLNDVPVVVSTNTRNLQSQLIEKDLPLVREAIQNEFGSAEAGLLRVALLKGRTNYFCLRRLAILLEHAQYELERPELRLFADVVAWVVQSADGDLDTFAGRGHADASFLSKLVSTGEECSGRSCRFYTRCFLQKARSRAARAHVIVANHALVFSEAQSPGSTLPPYTQIVFDEAHNLEEVATRHLSIEVSQARLNQLLRRLSRGRGRSVGGVLEVLRHHLLKGAITTDEETARDLQQRVRKIKNEIEETQICARRFFELLHGLLVTPKDPTRFRCIQRVSTAESVLVREVFRERAFCPCAACWSEADLEVVRTEFKQKLACVSADLNELAEALRLCAAQELPLYGDQAANVEGAATLLRDFGMDIDFVLSASDADHVFWVEPMSRSATTVRLFAAPLKIASALAELLYQKKSSVVFCSATLRVGSSFRFISDRLGINLIEQGRCVTCVAESPFNYLTQCAALAATFLPQPMVAKGGGYTEQLSGLMLDVFLQTRGRAMGLFTSYEMMNQVARLLEAPLQEAGIRLLVHGVNGTRDQITQDFRSGDACVLLGTHSFWEGVDVAGEALSCVVMARLPFAVVGDPIIEARCEQITLKGGNAFYDFTMPQAVIRFRQGFGRLIRTQTDKGVVIIADPRVFTKNYGATFRKSLPCPLLRVETRSELLKRMNTLFV